NGKIAKSRIDYNDFQQLRQQVEEFKPDVIGIRCMTFYKDSFHKTVARLRQWGVEAVIIAGGPYATINYDTLLQDQNVDLAVLGEGELTFVEVIEKIAENGKTLPPRRDLEKINSIAFAPLQANAEMTTEPSATNWKWSREVILLDQAARQIAEKKGDNPGNDTGRTDTGTRRDSGNLAYIVFTSGSTGNPKGVLTSHANVNRVVKNNNYLEIQPGDRVLQLSNYAFDGSVFDIYGALLNGASLVLLKNEEVINVTALSKILKDKEITVFFVTTALFNLLVDLNIESFRRIRKVLFGGERVSVDHCRKALEYMGKNKIIHVYGPTETTVYATYYFIDEIGENINTIPIGRPIANTLAYVVDKKQRLLPVGIAGELVLGGEGVARGYLNNPELTTDKFIPNLFGDKQTTMNTEATHPTKLYKSGDLVRRLADGNIEFLGRIDQQVKIRGYRIEPGEIEARLMQMDIIEDAVIMVKDDKSGEKYLCAYVVPAETGDLDIQELKKRLGHRLPDFMVPGAFVQLEKIPLTSNGKVDRNALPEYEMHGSATYVAPKDPVEEKFVEIWAAVLNREKESIGIVDDFF
ncbi:MAG: amino acid adenylation domain-containing protein, partial [bacterium]|nr:amino acid adenylation domain-containing protein [bacterium]